MSALLESGLPGVAWELLRGAPAQTESEALLSCKAQLIRMTKSLNEGPYVKAIMEQGSCAGAVMEALVQLRSSPLRTAEAWVETARLESWPPPSGRWGAPNTVWLLCWQDGHRAEGFHNGLSLTPVRCAEVGRYSNIWLCISLRFLDLLVLLHLCLHTNSIALLFSCEHEQEMPNVAFIITCFGSIVDGNDLCKKTLPTIMYYDHTYIQWSPPRQKIMTLQW